MSSPSHPELLQMTGGTHAHADAKHPLKYVHVGPHSQKWGKKKLKEMQLVTHARDRPATHVRPAGCAPSIVIIVEMFQKK